MPAEPPVEGNLASGILRNRHLETTMPHRLSLPVLILACTPCIHAQDADPNAPRLSDMMSVAMEASQPLPEHDLLRGLVGDWNYVIEMTMPGSPALRGSGTTEVTEILGGRFIQMHSASVGPDEFENLMLMGYDSREGMKDYFMVGIDSLGHYSVDLRGDWNPSAGTLTLDGTQHDPASGRDMTYRQVYRFPGTDVMTCEVYLEVPGVREDVRMVGIVYQRVAADHDGGTAAPKSAPAVATRPASAREVSDAPSWTADEIEAMDFAELQGALHDIARARSIPEMEEALRSNLGGQFRSIMDQMRRRRASADDSDAPSGGASASLPAYGDEMIESMTRSQARAALAEIITARSIPDLDEEQRAQLGAIFRKVVARLRETSGSEGAGRDLETAEKEAAASEPDRSGADAEPSSD